MSELSRRTLLGSATVLAASATLPTLAAQSPYSPEFREWYALAKTTSEVIVANDAWEEANPDADRDEGPDAMLSADMEKLEDVIFARPVRSQTDIDELAIIALYWTETEVAPGEDPNVMREFALGRDSGVESPCRDDRANAHLIQAVATIAMQRFGLEGA